MASNSHREKRQIRVPSKFVDSDYGTKTSKKKKKQINKGLIDEIDDDEGKKVCGKDGIEIVNQEISKSFNVSHKPAINNVEHDNVKVSFASVLNNYLDNKLCLIPTEMGTDGVEFKNEEGIRNVIENGPWMVNGKPMFVQKWDPTVCLDKAEPKKLPVWVKFRKLPLESWSTKGLSAIASRLGTPFIMDQITTQMCNLGMERWLLEF
ncbi:RNA-directed DNA polymerase, eukaryota, reverse transcriptase zinc-binding domain protein [Tanacetum coccineum]|uniref:RNA-directed DNA polymerase, eukaryota, reverse transcriptase zinc-binding domain protein n=1 Tax=Tanacetum coccineum TaxID=301880 RepID=A0ABQ5AQY8_9ASTR